MDFITSWEREEGTISTGYEWSHERSVIVSSGGRPNDEDFATVIIDGPPNHEREESSSSKRVKEINKRCKAIYEDEGYVYGSDTSDEETLVDRFRTATELRQKRIEIVMKEIRRSRNVELAFLIDATGSMQQHIDGVRKSIKEIVDRLKDSEMRDRHKKQKMKIALVAYRDHDDDNQFEVLGFTNSIPDFEAFCEKIVADGGGDTPEDVFGGLEKALELEWSTKACTKVIFHICDAPCHGKEFHTDSYSDDDDPKEDPKGRKHTDKMLEEFSDAEVRDSYPAGEPKGRAHTNFFARLHSAAILLFFPKLIYDSTVKMLEELSDGEIKDSYPAGDPKGRKHTDKMLEEFFDGEIRDSYPAGDPKGRTHTDLFARLRSKGIHYYFGKINDLTDKMLEKFSEAYGEKIVDFNVEDVENITSSVSTAVFLSVSNVVNATKKATRVGLKERSFIFELADPDWKKCPTLKGKFISYVFPASIQSIIDDVPLIRTPVKSAEIKIAPNPFARGAERIAFYGQDRSPYVNREGDEVIEKIVLKEYLHERRGVNTATRYQYSNQMQTIAAFLATKFTKDIKKMRGIKEIKFAKIRTLSLQLPDGNVRYLSAEKRFGRTDKFIRFSNNAGYEIMEERALSQGVPLDFVQLVTAFSHWSHQVTKGFLMVVDLEGVISNIPSLKKEGVILTDPAIHCKDVTRFGPMNHGQKGMDNFFGRHKCNKYCTYLNLDAH